MTNNTKRCEYCKGLIRYEIIYGNLLANENPFKVKGYYDNLSRSKISVCVSCENRNNGG